MPATYTKAEAKRTEREINENLLRAHKRAETKALKEATKLYEQRLRAIVPVHSGRLRQLVSVRAKLARKKNRLGTGILPSRLAWIGAEIEEIDTPGMPPPHVYFRWVDQGTVERETKRQRNNARRGMIVPQRLIQRTDDATFTRAASVYNAIYEKSFSTAGSRLLPDN